MNAPAETPLFLPLSEVAAAGVGLVGGKARGFALLAGAGLPVPDGFVVTTAAYRLAAAGGAKPPAPTAELSRRIEALVAAMGAEPLAVRSSAVDEDGAERSSAGQYLTRLGVRGARAAAAAVAECWASADAAVAAAYRRARAGADRTEMAVIVQRLVDPEAAGVCFSADPVTGERDVIRVNASYGLGEAVVSGMVTPDDYRIARDDGRLLDVVIGDKDLMLVPGPDGVREVPVPPQRRERAALDAAALAALREGVLRCEERAGAPVDCEFCVRDGAVVWLQCRPLTALPPARAKEVR